MKIRKILTGMSVAAIAASMMAVGASAAETYKGKANVGTMKPITLDSQKDDAKLVQIPLDSIWPEDTTATITNVTMTLCATNAPAAYWIGGGGAIGFDVAPNQGNTTDDLHWMQSDTAKVGSNDDRKDEDGDGNKDGELTLAHCTWEESWDYTYTENADFSEGGKLMQFGWWWGAGDTVDITDWKVTFSDGTVVTLVSEDGTYDTVADYSQAVKDEIAKQEREKAAKDAIDALKKAVDGASFQDVIDKMNGAADGLKNAAAVLDEADKALEDVKALEDKLKAAEDAVKALEEGDEYDKDAYDAAKKAVEDASKNLAAAKTALEDAMKAYDAKTAEQIKKKDDEISKLNTEKEDLQKQIDELKKAAETDASKAAENAKKIEELEKQVAAKDTEIASLKSDKDKLAKDLEDAKKNAGTTTTTTTTDKKDDGGSNPKMGAEALAFVGLALAGTAVVVSKKRK